MKFTSTLFLFVIGFAGIDASREDCYLKYSGDLVVTRAEDNKVGVALPQGLLGRANSFASGDVNYQATKFSFYECDLDGYYASPEEHGFLIADAAGTTDVCSTANKFEGSNTWAYVDHEKCDYDAQNASLINRQLVYANYYDPGNGPVIDIFFQGSPQIKTNTGFSLRNAFFNGLGAPYGEFNSAILSNQTNSLHYSRLQLNNITIERDSSIVQGQRTRNEERIARSLSSGSSLNLSNSVRKTYSSKKTIF